MIMLLDLLSTFVLLLSDFFQYTFTNYCFTSSLFSSFFSLQTIILISGSSILSFLVWKSTDTPDDIPSPPPPPFVISIRASDSTGEGRGSLRDVRLLSSGNQQRGVQEGSTNNQQTPLQTQPQRIPLFHRILLQRPAGQPGQGQGQASRYIFRRLHNFRARLYTPGPSLFLYQRYWSQSHRRSGQSTISIPDTEDLPNTHNTSMTTNNNIGTGNLILESGEEPEAMIPIPSTIPSSAPEAESISKSDDPQLPTPASEDDVKFTIKFLNDTQIDVITNGEEKVGDFKRRHFSQELQENKTVRLIYGGRVLDNDYKTLKEYGISDHCVVHCLVITAQQRQSDPSQSTNPTGSNPNHRHHGSTSRTGRNANAHAGPEPGLFFVSLMGVILLFLWFICFNFGQQLFTQSAVVSLTVLTAIFIVGLVAFYLPVNANNNVNN